MFTSSDLISHVIIFGDSKPFLIALIFINNDYSKKNDISIILRKKDIVIAKSDLDITDKFKGKKN